MIVMMNCWWDCYPFFDIDMTVIVNNPNQILVKMSIAPIVINVILRSFRSVSLQSLRLVFLLFHE